MTWESWLALVAVIAAIFLGSMAWDACAPAAVPLPSSLT